MRGREHERDLVRGLLDQARRGRAGVLGFRGEPGGGKTTLCDAAVAMAAEPSDGVTTTVLAVRGTEVESDLPLAALFALLRPLRSHVAGLPTAQCEVARALLDGVVDLGGPSGTPGGTGEPGTDRLALGAVTLALLSAAAEDGPLLVVVDDAHWVDPLSGAAMVFAFRRLVRDAVAVLVAGRPVDPDPMPGDWPRHDLPGLPDDDVVALLAPRGVADAVARRLARACGGNPLAVLELAAGLTTRQAGGREPLPDPLPLGPRGVASFGRRVEGLSAATLAALAVVAAAAEVELPAVADVLAAVGRGVADLEPAERAGLVVVGVPVRFTHPLVRASAAAACGPETMRRAHAAWADRGRGDPVRRARHLAEAATGVSEPVAAALEHAGELAGERGGVAAGAGLLGRAADLTPDADTRARRRLRAAEACFLAGWRADAADHVAAVLAADVPADVEDQALALEATFTAWADFAAEVPARVGAVLDRLAGRAPDLAALVAIQLGVIQWGSGAPHGGTATLDRAVTLAVSDPIVRRLLDFTRASMRLGVADPGPFAAYAAREDPADPTGLRDAVLDRFPGQYQAAVRAWTWWGDLDRGMTEVQAQVERARRRSAHALLPLPLMLRGEIHLLRGEVLRARADLVEALQLAETVGMVGAVGYVHGLRAWVAAVEGDEHAVRHHAAAALATGGVADPRPVAMYANHALGLFELGAGRPAEAARHLDANVAIRRAFVPLHPGTVLWQADHVEALVASGRTGEARTALRLLEQDAERSASPWARAVALRGAALVAGPDPGDLFARALDAQRDMPLERARTLLCLGEHLRRSRRIRQAREALAEAVRALTDQGARPWLRRAEAEHRAAGGRPAGPHPAAGLTDRELQICLAVADGATNREVGATLFLSPKTVEYHLGHAFRKLGVTHRAQLAALVGHGLLAAPEGTG